MIDRFLGRLNSEIHLPVAKVVVQNDAIGEFYLAKVLLRTQRLYERLECKDHYSVMALATELSFPEEVPPSPAETMSELERHKNWPRLISPLNATFIHGDLHFGNLVVTDWPQREGPSIRLVDGKDQPFPGMPPAVGDPAYDFGKLLVSANTGLDVMPTPPGRNDKRVELRRRAHASLGDRIEREIVVQEKQFGQGFRDRCHLLHALHMITLPGAKSDMPRAEAAAMYAIGAELLYRRLVALSKPSDGAY